MLFFIEKETEVPGGKVSKVMGSFIPSLTQQPLVEHVLLAGWPSVLQKQRGMTHTPPTQESRFKPTASSPHPSAPPNTLNCSWICGLWGQHSRRQVFLSALSPFLNIPLKQKRQSCYTNVSSRQGADPDFPCKALPFRNCTHQRLSWPWWSLSH